MGEHPLVSIDCETTALHPWREPWEVAVIRREPDGALTERTWMLPVSTAALRSADPVSLRVGGFYDRHPYGRTLAGREELFGGEAYGPDADRDIALREIGVMLHGARPVIGAVPSFDLECLLEPLLGAGVPPAWHHRIRCVETVTAGFLRRDVGGLADCAKALGIDHQGAHTALGDARTALRIWDHVMGGAEEVAAA